VDATPGDVSVYGVRGLAGNVSDWCANPWRRDGPSLAGDRLLPDEAEAEFMSVRGGNFSSSARLCRPASRLAGRPDEVFSTVGLRLARSLPRST
jgi:serine/threonine-protein kinase